MTFIMIFCQKDILSPFVNRSKAQTQKCWNCFIDLSGHSNLTKARSQKEGLKGKMLPEMDQRDKVHNIKSLSCCRNVQGLGTPVNLVEERPRKCRWWEKSMSKTVYFVSGNQSCPFAFVPYIPLFINHLWLIEPRQPGEEGVLQNLTSGCWVITVANFVPTLGLPSQHHTWAAVKVLN